MEVNNIELHQTELRYGHSSSNSSGGRWAMERLTRVVCDPQISWRQMFLSL